MRSDIDIVEALKANMDLRMEKYPDMVVASPQLLQYAIDEIQRLRGIVPPPNQAPLIEARIRKEREPWKQLKITAAQKLLDEKTVQFEKMFKSAVMGKIGPVTENGTEYIVVCARGIKEEGVLLKWIPTAQEAIDKWFEMAQEVVFGDGWDHPRNAILVWRIKPEIDGRKVGKREEWKVYSRFAWEFG